MSSQGLADPKAELLNTDPLFKIYLFLESEERREKERDTNTNVQEKRQLAASCMPPPGDLAHTHAGALTGI